MHRACTCLAVLPLLAACGSSRSTATPLTGVDASDDAAVAPPPPVDAATGDAAVATCSSYAADATPLRLGGVLGITHVYSDRDRANNPDPNAWKGYGFDLDGQATTESSTNHCQPVAGANVALVKTDGVGGIDNAFAAIIAPIIASFDTAGKPGWVDNWNAGLEGGRARLLLRFPTPIPPSSDAATPAPLAAQIYSAGPVCADAPVMTPRLLPVDRASVQSDDVDRALNVAPAGTLTGDTWSSDVIDSVIVTVPIKSGSLPLHLRKVRISLQLAPDRKSATLGMLGGIATTDELAAVLRKNRGNISPLACLPGVFDSYEQKIRRASDIMADGTQDPTKTCDGISLGIGFDATEVAIGSLETIAPSDDSCPAKP